MFCSNCGAKNDKKQNYCRFCGLDVRDTSRSLTTQLAFGKDSDSLKKLRTVKRTVDIASAILVAVWITAAVADIFFMVEFGSLIMRISLGLFILFQVVQGAVGYIQRKERNKTKPENPNRIKLATPANCSKTSHSSRPPVSRNTLPSYFRSKIKPANLNNAMAGAMFINDRYLDKLVDQLAKGKTMEKILRKANKEEPYWRFQFTTNSLVPVGRNAQLRMASSPAR